MALGKRIKQCLDEKGWSQVDLLERVPELTASSLSALISRDSKTSEQLFKIAKSLGAHAEWLQDGSGPQWLNQPAIAESTATYNQEGKVILDMYFSVPPTEQQRIRRELEETNRRCDEIVEWRKNLKKIA